MKQRRPGTGGISREFHLRTVPANIFREHDVHGNHIWIKAVHTGTENDVVP